MIDLIFSIKNSKVYFSFYSLNFYNVIENLKIAKMVRGQNFVFLKKSEIMPREGKNPFACINIEMEESFEW